MQHKRFNTIVSVLTGLLCLSASLAWTARSLAQAPAATQVQPAADAAKPAADAAKPAADAAKPAADAVQEPATEAEREIDLAIKKLTAIKSISADMVQSVDMLKQKFEVKGRFLRAPSSRVYLKLTVTGLPDSAGTMLQVCDGETLWDYQQVLESQMYRKLSIKPIFERLNSPDLDAKTRDQILAQMGFAGPEALLMGLRKSVKFEQKEEGVIDGKPVWILRGSWRNRNGLVGPDQRPLPPTGPLPAYIPSLASLSLGKEDGWPYKIVLVGKVPTILQDTRQRDREGRLIGTKSSVESVQPSSITVLYTNVKINPDPPIRPEEFAFQAPPNAPVEDSTEALLKGLDQAIQVQAMQKRAEANRQDGPVIDQSIDIPKPPTEPTPR